MSMIQLKEEQLDVVFGGCCEPGPAYDNGNKNGWTRDEWGNLISPGKNGQGNAYGVLGDCQAPS